MKTKEEIVEEYRDGLVSAVNKMLDTIYESDNHESAKIYEDLRRSLIDKKELTVLQYSLLAILSTYNTKRFADLSEAYKKTSGIFEEIATTIQEDLKEKK